MVVPPTPPFWRIAVVENYIDLSCFKVCLLCLVCRLVVKEQQNIYVPFLGLHHCDVIMYAQLTGSGSSLAP